MLSESLVWKVRGDFMKINKFLLTSIFVFALLLFPCFPSKAALPVVNGNSYTWTLDNSGWRMKDDNGNPVSSWVSYKNDTYYLNESGFIKTGWVIYEKGWYFLDDSGKLVKDKWVYGTYYVDSEGKMTKKK